MMLSDVLLNGKAVLELSTICHASKARDRAKAVVFKLKNELPRQQFSIAIQVSMDNGYSKYTIRSIVCEASCHSVTWSLGHLVTQSYDHYLQHGYELTN